MKNEMRPILESWRRTTLLEGVADLIKNKTLDGETVDKIGEKLSDNKSFQLAVRMFSSLDKMDPDELKGLDEGALEWIDSKIVQGLVAKNNLVDTLRSDSRFAPIMKLAPPALALAYLYVKHNTGGIDPDDFTSAAEIIAKKGKIDLDGLAQGTEVLENKRN